MPSLTECASNLASSTEQLLSASRRGYPELAPGDYGTVIVGMAYATPMLRTALIKIGGNLRSYYQLAEANGGIRRGTGASRRNSCTTLALRIGLVGRHCEAAQRHLISNIAGKSFAGASQPPQQILITKAAREVDASLAVLSAVARNLKAPTIEELRHFTYMENVLGNYLAAVEHLGLQRGVCKHLPDLVAAAHRGAGMARKGHSVSRAIVDYGRAMDRVAKKLRDVYAQVSGDVTKFNSIAKATAA
jgi:hypothetical protein